MNNRAVKSLPPLYPALAAMTGLQGVVALALFAPGVLAPGLGIDEQAIALFTTGCFGVGMVTALFGGALIARFGSFAVAAGCMVFVILSMMMSSLATPIALAFAGAILGLAFGPETPASSALLGHLATPRQVPMVFSLRQTGNQLGAILGSLTLPAIARFHPELGFVLIAALAAFALAIFASLRPRYDALTRQSVQAVPARAALSLLWNDAPTRRLALASMPLAAMQLGLNAFLVIYLVRVLDHSHGTAGLVLAIAQGGGLVGRLGWGYVASRWMAPRQLIAALAMAMALCAASLACLPPHATLPLLATIAFAFGLTASGWNGVLLAEVARAAPDGQVGAATGAVLTASYGGLVLGPPLMSLVSSLADLRFAYGVLALACLFVGLAMMRQPLVKRGEVDAPRHVE